MLNTNGVSIYTIFLIVALNANVRWTFLIVAVHLTVLRFT